MKSLLEIAELRLYDIKKDFYCYRKLVGEVYKRQQNIEKNKSDENTLNVIKTLIDEIYQTGRLEWEELTKLLSLNNLLDTGQYQMGTKSDHKKYEQLKSRLFEYTFY